MGGKMQVYSEAGAGACFSFMIPFIKARTLSRKTTSREIARASSSDNEPVHQLARLLKDKLVLLAEDSTTNQRVIVLQLSKFGLNIHVAKNGSEAVNLAETHTYDLILMDCQMPGIDGFDATAAIRTREQKSGFRTPIVGLTAQAMDGDRERCLLAGMDDYVSKPATLDKLEEILQKWVIARQQKNTIELRGVLRRGMQS
jgi:CheY-like chemotaxis protein